MTEKRKIIEWNQSAAHAYSPDGSSHTKMMVFAPKTSAFKPIFISFIKFVWPFYPQTFAEKYLKIPREKIFVLLNS